ncbi:MAG: hypothetical protein ACXWBM_07270 [Chthoniobacterales bacterium]
MHRDCAVGQQREMRPFHPGKKWMERDTRLHRFVLDPVFQEHVHFLFLHRKFPPNK